MRKHVLLLTCAVSALSSIAGMAIAAATDDKAATEVTTVVITAEKRTVNLQKVPVAVSAYTSKQRDLIGINTIQDVANFTPGLVYSSILDRASIRGIGRLTNVLTSDAAVATYTDGFYTTSTVEAGKPTIDIERVEVLRGPQGTLYGRNSIGGAINVISKRPTETPYAEGRFTIGNYNATDYEIAASDSLAKGLAGRILAYYQRQEQGYFINVAGGPSTGNKIANYYVEPQFNVKMGDHTEWWTKVFVSGWNSRGGPGDLNGFYTTKDYDYYELSDEILILFNPAYGYSAIPGSDARAFIMSQPAGLPGTGRGPNPALQGSLVQVGSYNHYPAFVGAHRRFNNDFNESIKLNNARDIDTLFTYHFPAFDFKYTGGYQAYHYDLKWDIDGTDVLQYTIPLTNDPMCAGGQAETGAANKCLIVHPQYDFHYQEFNQWYSHEITFASTGTNALQWIGGAYLYNEHYSNPQAVLTPNQPQVFAPMLAATAPFASTPGGVTNLANTLQNAIILTGTPAPNPSGQLYHFSYGSQTKSVAVYGQLDWKAIDTLKATLGLRYTKDNKDGTEDYRALCFSDFCTLAFQGAISAEGPSPLQGAAYPGFDITDALVPYACDPNHPIRGVVDPIQSRPNPSSTSGCTTQYFQFTHRADGIYTRRVKTQSSAVTGTAGFEWTPTDDVLGYVRYGRGYKAGATNLGTLTASPVTDPEHANAYEIGLKETFFKRLVVDSALYYTDYQNLQIPITVQNGAFPIGTFFNVPKAYSRGFELETNWTPIDHLNTSLSYSFNDTKILSACKLVDPVNGITKGTCFQDDADPEGLDPQAQVILPATFMAPSMAPPPPPSPQAPHGIAIQGVKGNPLPYAPLHKVALNGNYTMLFDPGSLSFSGTYIWRAEAYANLFKRNYNLAPAWNQVDVRTLWKGTDDKYELIGYVKNVFDSEGYPAPGGGNIYDGVTHPLTDPGPLAGYRAYTQSKIRSLSPPRTFGLEMHYKFL